MSSKTLRTALLALSLTLLYCLMAGPAMANTKVIHSYAGYYKPAGKWVTNHSSWYGPGFYWNHCADGQVLLPPGSKHLRLWRKHPRRYVYYGVATLCHYLPFGTWVELDYRGLKIVVPIVDRGWYPSREYDLTGGTMTWFNWEAKKLHLKHYVPYSGVPSLKWRIVKKIKKVK